MLWWSLHQSQIFTTKTLVQIFAQQVSQSLTARAFSANVIRTKLSRDRQHCSLASTAILLKKPMLDKNLQKEIQKSFQIMFIARVYSLLSLYIYALVICKWNIEYIYWNGLANHDWWFGLPLNDKVALPFKRVTVRPIGLQSDFFTELPSNQSCHFIISLFTQMNYDQDSGWMCIRMWFSGSTHHLIKVLPKLIGA